MSIYVHSFILARMSIPCQSLLLRTPRSVHSASVYEERGRGRSTYEGNALLVSPSRAIPNPPIGRGAT
ncbi:uncharacterized protein ARMOST_22700 [Armillaria ostoyae]|uniref:Uncharacterized protein n=1 Tax=Armillaria ostoyae TaxID=47428 RepID=A0A284SDK0_ARMOS|nr:uncharacterized protein ARMOST_22610 [Armillaria ostoyae]SJL19035.1 uncharacterized protein ARMOST_22642 [Armillaria ostoyae]SJL19092.1 uncharacterized protein ARMOST_22700 [Armillaria ostoyae]